MLKTITPSDMKRIETLVMKETTITGEMLMERAAAHVARSVSRCCGGKSDTVLCLCGTGNNGGDGIAAMRLLAAKDESFACECWIMEGVYSPDLLRELEKLQKLLAARKENRVKIVRLTERILPPAPSHIACVVDALFGTGLTRNLEGVAQTLVSFSNKLFAAGVPVIAVDIPSGLHGETGKVMGSAIFATETITFHRPKVGLYMQKGLDYSGKITVTDIGLPASYDDAKGCLLLEKSDLASMLPNRKRTTHKGNYGRVLFFAGHRGMAGAAALAATAALRTGAGLVTVACDERILDIVQMLCPCATCIPLPLDDICAAWDLLVPAIAVADAIGAGCGLGQSTTVCELLPKLISYANECGKPLVLDADALNLIAAQNLQGLGAQTILTPHPAEAARLLGGAILDVTAEPVLAAKQLRGRYGSSIVLKGAASILLAGDAVAINPFGTPAMAKGGSGDVLTGIIAALCAGRAQGVYALDDLSLLQTACALHGLAGVEAEKAYGERGVLATDLCIFLGKTVDKRRTNLALPLDQTPKTTLPTELSPLGKIAFVTIDHAFGTRHSDDHEMIYKLNHGYVSEVLNAGNDWQDAYVYGVGEPLEWFEGEVIAIIHRLSDASDQWVVAKRGTRASAQQIKEATAFAEQFYESTIEVL